MEMNNIMTVLLMLLACCFTGCIGVTRVPERVRTPQGSQKKIDLSFLQPGKTTHAEVMEKLKLVDSGFQSERFFLGRWTDSKWGGWAVAVGDGNSAGGAKRCWENVNLLAEFDDKETLTRYEIFPDKRLIEKL